jgi:hypothetical protein
VLGRFCWWLDILFADRRHERKIGNEKRSARNQPRFEAEWQRVCRMPGITKRLVASPSAVCGVRPHRMLRQFSESACVQACGCDRTPDHYELRTRRGLVLRLRETADGQRCGITSPALASGGSNRTRTVRKSPSQLGITPALAGVYHFSSDC